MEIGSLDDIKLPLVPLRDVEVEVMRKGPRDTVLDSSAKLDGLTQKALDFYDDLLSEPLSLDDGKLLAAQTDAARTILSTQIRVDDSRLRKRTTDTLAALLERIDQEDV